MAWQSRLCLRYELSQISPLSSIAPFFSFFSWAGLVSCWPGGAARPPRPNSQKKLVKKNCKACEGCINGNHAGAARMFFIHHRCLLSSVQLFHRGVFATVAMAASYYEELRTLLAKNHLISCEGNDLMMPPDHLPWARGSLLNLEEFCDAHIQSDEKQLECKRHLMCLLGAAHDSTIPQALQVCSSQRSVAAGVVPYDFLTPFPPTRVQLIMLEASTQKALRTSRAGVLMPWTTTASDALVQFIVLLGVLRSSRLADIDTLSSSEIGLSHCSRTKAIRGLCEYLVSDRFDAVSSAFRIVQGKVSGWGLFALPPPTCSGALHTHPLP